MVYCAAMVYFVGLLIMNPHGCLLDNLYDYLMYAKETTFAYKLMDAIAFLIGFLILFFIWVSMGTVISAIAGLAMRLMKRVFS